MTEPEKLGDVLIWRMAKEGFGIVEGIGFIRAQKGSTTYREEFIEGDQASRLEAIQRLAQHSTDR